MSDLKMFEEKDESSLMTAQDLRAKKEKYNDVAELFRSALINILEDMSQGHQICCNICEEQSTKSFIKDQCFLKKYSVKLEKISELFNELNNQLIHKCICDGINYAIN